MTQIETDLKLDRAPLDKTNEDGFTLVEVLVTLLIITLMIGFAVANFFPFANDAKITRVKGDIATIETALEMYRLDQFDYPDQTDGLEALTSRPASVAEGKYRQGGYIKKMSVDPWGNPYQYRYPGERAEVDIFSLGADGEEGGEGQDADIGNWQ